MAAGRVVALLPMRDQSERVPGKNLRPCAGAPLFHHVLRSLLDCPEVAEVVIDTDSDAVSRNVARHFPGVRVLQRPEWLQGGTVSMNEVLCNDVTQVAAEHYLQTHSTNPLLRTATITRAVESFFAALSTHDSLFSVTRHQTRLWDAQGRALNHDPAVLMRTQDLPPVYEENSCLYVFSGERLLARRNRIGERPLLFETDTEEAWDIDEELDFEIAEFLFRRRVEAGR